MNRKILVLGLVFLAAGCQAYENSSQNTAYNQLIGHAYIDAVETTFVAAWGDWFYFLLAAGPYIGMYLYQRSITIPSIWLASMLAAYGYFLKDIPHYVMYLLAVMWVMHVLVRLLSPAYER